MCRNANKTNELLSTIEMMFYDTATTKKKETFQTTKRSPEEQKIIDSAKAVLMERNNMTENEGVSIYSKCSMDSGNTRWVESAQMVMDYILWRIKKLNSY